MKYLIYIFPLLLLPPLYEAALFCFSKTSTADGEIFYYLIYISIGIFLSIILIFSTSSETVQKSYFTDDFSFTSFELFFITSIAITPFLYFIHTSINGYSLIDLVVFSEEYRNGKYKGSGIYTAPLIQFVPAMLSLNIALGDKFNKGFIFSLLILILGTLVLGQRIYLLKVFLAFLYRATKIEIKVIKLFMLFFVIFTFLSIYKIFLDADSIDEKGTFDYLLNPITRLNFSALVRHDIGHGISQIHCLLPTMQYSDICGGEFLKTEYLSNNSKISSGFPLLSKFSGVAIPLPVFLYNIFGMLGTAFFTGVLIFIAMLYKYIENRRSGLIGKIIGLALLLTITSTLVEDFLASQFLDISIAVGFVIFGLIRFRIFRSRHPNSI